MHFQEYGVNRENLVLVLQNREISRRMEQEVFGSLAQSYHVVVPVLDPQDNLQGTVESIATYIRERYQGHVYAVCSTNDGWKLASAILFTQHIDTLKTIIEGQEEEAGELIASFLKESA